MDGTNGRKYELLIKNREVMTLNGVINVENFGEDYLTLCTDLGDVIVEGKELKIESLEKENGVIVIKGRIDGVFYKDKNSEKGFFKKLFK